MRPIHTINLLMFSSLALLFTSASYAETINENLVVTGTLTVDGNVAFKSQTANQKSFYIGGDAATYYPVRFTDRSWSYGEMDLQVYRTNVHADSTWQGSMMTRFRTHASGWGHGSDFTDASIRQYYTPHLADYKRVFYSNGIVLWLKGQSTYYYHVEGEEPGIQYNDSGDGYILIREYNGAVVESYSARSDVSDSVLTNGNTFDDNVFVKGNVGIGIANPENKLDVAGRIRAEEIIVDTGWADYVFEDGYELRSLDEVESHIEEHGHLPGVPNASDVAESGVSLGDSHRILLEKVEELTLYVIELKKENKEQRLRIEELESITAQQFR